MMQLSRGMDAPSRITHRSFSGSKFPQRQATACTRSTSSSSSSGGSGDSGSSLSRAGDKSSELGKGQHSPRGHGQRSPAAAPSKGRRAALLQLAAVPLFLDTSRRWLRPQEAQASLVQFPAATLRNKYFLVRAGESQAEADGFVLTNPVAKTSMQSGLSEVGKRQVVKGTLEQLQSAEGWSNDNVYFWPSITQRSYQTAEILGSLLGWQRNRIVPEFSFLDPRGLGALEGYTLQEAAQQLGAGDSQSPSWRPLRNYDGTPNESVLDVLVRMRQVLSITETQWSNAAIVIISPDSDNLSVLQSAAVGGDLRDHRRFAFGPGECRRLQLAMDLPIRTQNSRFSCPHPPACV